MTKDAYTVRDIAEQLQVTERTVRQAIDSGELKAKKVLGKWIVAAAAFEDFISRSTTHDTQGAHDTQEA